MDAQEQLCRCVDELAQVYEALDKNATRPDGIGHLVGADPLSMERDAELQGVLDKLEAIIDQMREALVQQDRKAASGA